MTITLIDNSSKTGQSAKADTLECTTDIHGAQQGHGFAEVMSTMLTQAASGPHESPAGTELPSGSTMPFLGQESTENPSSSTDALDTTRLNAELSLKAITLSPHLNVITAMASAPNEQSLQDFARAQGLDEQAVHWLLGPVPGQHKNPSPSSSADTAEVALQSGLYGALITPPIASLKPLEPTAATSPQVNGINSAELAPTAPAPIENKALPNSPTASLSASALWLGASDAMAPPSASKAPSGSGVESTDSNHLPFSALRMPPPAPVWMQAQTLVSPTTRPATAAPSVSVTELDLTEILTEDAVNTPPDLDDLSTTPHTHANSTHHLKTPQDATTLLTSGSAEPEYAQRSEHIQNLAEKLGQAVGQRILSEIEKGQWHLKLMLRPATLGHIEVEMRMRSGELDAVFIASQTQTRDLLQDGMSRLRETLSQMGMDVASLNIGNGQTAQHGEQSTPKPAVPKVSASTEPETTEQLTSGPKRRKISQDGLDILV